MKTKQKFRQIDNVNYLNDFSFYYVVLKKKI